MQVDRRQVIGGLLAGSGAAFITPKTLASTMIGEATLITVSDGYLTLPGEFVFGPMPADELPDILSRYEVSADQLTPECNLALYDDGTRKVLFDVGSGPDFMPSAGSVLDSLDALGLAPEDVTDVVFTHAHPDHIWGLIDDFDDLVFPDAAYHMGQAEWDYWWDPETVNTIGEARASFAVGAKRRMERIADSVTLFGDGGEVLPGITAIATPGHTPGHMAFEVGSSGETALVVGDAIGNHHVAFARPSWESGSDQDRPRAVSSRMMLFDRLIAENLLVVGFHLPGGGMGRAEKDGDGFRFVPEAL